MLNDAADYGKNGLESKKEEEIRGGEEGYRRGRGGEGKRSRGEGKGKGMEGWGDKR